MVVASLTLLVLSNMYMLFLAALPVGLIIVSVLATERGRRWRLDARIRRRPRRGGAAPPAGRSAVSRAQQSRMGLVHDDEHAADYSAHLLSYASVHTSSPWLPWVRTEITGDQALYPGLVLLLPLFMHWRSRRVRRGIDSSGRRSALLYGTIGLALRCSSRSVRRFGTADADVILTSPYAWLRDHVPGLAAVRAPGRFAAIVAVIACRARRPGHDRAHQPVVGEEPREPGDRGDRDHRARSVAEGVARGSRCRPSGRAVDRQLYAWLARQPAAAMLELPASSLSAQVPLVELYHQYATLHHPHRLINGYSGFNPASADLLETHHSPFITLDRLR